MNAQERVNLKARLVTRGFDRTAIEDGRVYPKCSQCEVLVLNGTACHEIGCPNQKRG